MASFDMAVEHIDVPYHYDVTNITPVTNLVIEKLQEIAKEQMITIDIPQYVNVDLAKMTEIYNKIAEAQYNLCVQVGIPTSLAARKYQAIDYNSIISTFGYLGDSLNNIIDELNNMTQSPAKYE